MRNIQTEAPANNIPRDTNNNSDGASTVRTDKNNRRSNTMSYNTTHNGNERTWAGENQKLEQY